MSKSPSTLLLVEGPDDEHVVKNLCGRMEIGLIDEIRFQHRLRSSAQSKGASNDREAPCGKEALLKALPNYLETRGEELTALGVLLDADDDRDASWRSITHTLHQLGYADLPAQPDPAGTVIQPPDRTIQPPQPNAGASLPGTANPLPLPRIGIWIMPDNQLDGTLEDFLKFLVPDGDVLLPYAGQVLDNLPDTRFTSPHRPKALMHTWLAWQNEPGKPYGQAISAKYLNTDLPMAKTFANWLRRTFFDD